MKIARHWMSILFLVLVAGGTVWVVRRNRVPGSMTVLESQAMDMNMALPEGASPVATARVERSQFRPSLRYTGSVEAYGDQDVVARITGRVVKLYVYPGQQVAPGALIAELDSAEVDSKSREANAAARVSRAQAEAARSSVEKARLELLVSREEYRSTRLELSKAAEETALEKRQYEVQEAESARTDELYRQGGASQEEHQIADLALTKAHTEWHHSRIRQMTSGLKVEQAVDNVKAQKQELSRAEAELAAMRANSEKSRAEQQTADITRGYTEIRAQEGGEVTQRLVSPGTLVMPGTVLVKTQQQSRARLQVRIPARYAAGLRVGWPVRVHLPEGGTFQVPVTAIFRAADPVSRTFIVEALADRHSAPRRLLPGEFLEMDVADQAPRELMSVPQAAVQQDLEGHSYVWRVQQVSSTKTIYTCVMHPEVRLDHPGVCPKCGMKLVPAEKSGDLRAEKALVHVVGFEGEKAGLSSGLKANDEVVVAGFESLKNGSPIARTQWGINGPAALPAPAAHPAGAMPGMPGMKDMPGMTSTPEPSGAASPTRPNDMKDMPGMGNQK